jgi:acyl-CoA thioesterase-1
MGLFGTRKGDSAYGLARRLFNAALLAATVVAIGVPAVSVGTAAAREPVRILALGDSLTAGYGLPQSAGFTEQLQKALRDRGHAAIVELGANDMLRGLDPAAAKANLDAILKRMKDRGIPVLLTGMYASPGLGRAYGEAFNGMYPELAKKYAVPLYPFFLDGVATDAALNQGDGIHPNAAGVAVIVERILPHVVRLIETATTPKG